MHILWTKSEHHRANWKFHGDENKTWKYVLHHLFRLFLTDSWQFELIKTKKKKNKKMTPMRSYTREGWKGERERVRKRGSDESKIRREQSGRLAGPVLSRDRKWPLPHSSTPPSMSRPVHDLPFPPSLGFIRLAMGIKFHPLQVFERFSQTKISDNNLVLMEWMSGVSNNS